MPGDHRLAAGVAIGAALALAAVGLAARLAGMRWKREETEVRRSESGAGADPALLEEQLSRSAYFFGSEGQANVTQASIVVVGLGGVGSHAAHLLARTGVRRLTLIDFDLVTLSSLNRHALATRADVGLFKVKVMASHLKEFNPHIEIVTHTAILNESNALELLQGHDYVVDCIDDQTSKVQLLEACTTLQIPVISSLGAGGKADPTRLRIGSLFDSSGDPLAMRLRARISKLGNRISHSLLVFVYSTEEPPVSLLPHDASAVPVAEAGTLPDFRVRIMPVLGTMPALFGMAMASYALTQVSKTREFIPLPVVDVSRSLAHKLVMRLSSREEEVLGGPAQRLGEIEAMQLITLFRRQCVITGQRIGAQGKSPIDLARWDSGKPLDVDNCVLLLKPLVDLVYKHHAKRTGRAPELDAFAGTNVTAEMLANVRQALSRVKRVKDWTAG